ncbi:hypothetical protein BP5796_12989 [Coleophoma crateriformis]|uniref:DUF6594 domain-containing protein n=1 Tax=Coleophoma crateriformis TaxID=565419 RepID=A0A3D8Q536_9HELO|nr:hypothetical protein BP5796_12989 [Coleophoma crateriformis]
MAATEVGSVPSSPRTDSSTASDAGIPDDVNVTLAGWPLLSTLIAAKSDFQAFPSFADLNIKSLLYYQAELISLRKKLHQIEWKDRRVSKSEDSYSYADDLGLLLRARDLKPDLQPEQWRVMEKIRLVLEKYNHALLQFSKVSALPEADNCNVKCLSEFAKSISEGGGGVTGPGSQTWGDLEDTTNDTKPIKVLFKGLLTGFFVSPDTERKRVDKTFHERLITPRFRNKQDGLTLWVKCSFVPFYDCLCQKHLNPLVEWLQQLYSKLRRQRTESTLPSSETSIRKKGSSAGTSPRGHALEKDITEYSESWLLRTTSILTTVVACLLPTIAITVLSKVHTMSMILGLISLFTAIFAVGLILLSSTSSRVEIFTATAA